MGKVEDDEAIARLEAALYSAGRPLTIEELIKASGTESRTKTLSLMTGIVKKTKSAFRALEIASLPDGSYVFQLKTRVQYCYQKVCIKALASNCYIEDIIICCIHAANFIKKIGRGPRLRRILASQAS